MRHLYKLRQKFTLRNLLILVGLIAVAVFALSSTPVMLVVVVVFAAVIPFFLLSFGEAFRAVVWCTFGTMSAYFLLFWVSQVIFPFESPKAYSQKYLQFWAFVKFVPATALVLTIWMKWICNWEFSANEKGSSSLNEQ